MRFAVALLLLSVVAAIVAFWWWLGASVAMPESPLAPGEKLACVSYTPFRGRESPLDVSTRVDPARVEDDLARLAKLTGCIRTYSTGLGLDQVAGIAERHGLEVLQGVWLNNDPALNRREIDAAVALAGQYPRTITALVVGNETLLRGELAEADLAAIIRNVKTQVSVPVTYGDVWEFWLRYRMVAEAVDFITIHILPYWEDQPVAAAEAARHVDMIRRRIAETFPGKDILIGEVGWPSAGRMRDAALPSPTGQARVLHDVLALAKRARYRVNVIEAFDQPWKRALEGTVGGHWGLLDGDTRKPKFAWGQPLSNHPFWRLQAAGGVLLAGLILLAARLARRAPETPRTVAGIAVIALAAGLFAPWAIANVPLESLGLGGWAMSLTLATLSALAPAACAAALARGVAVPVVARVLGPREGRTADGVAKVLGLALAVLYTVSIATVLGLVFDARYRDFPFAPLTPAIAAFAVLAGIGHRPQGARGVPEILGALVIGASTIFFAVREGATNWQAMWLAAVLLVFALTLWRVRDARG